MIPKFITGHNVAMKIPSQEYESTLNFYRNILSLKEVSNPNLADQSPRFVLGDKILCLDSVATLSRAEVWLEILSEDVEAAAKYFEEQGCALREEIKPLLQGLKGFWVAGPSGIVF